MESNENPAKIDQHLAELEKPGGGGIGPATVKAKAVETGPLGPEQARSSAVRANVRAKPNHQNVKLMMGTTETRMEPMTRALDAGASEYVRKPFPEEVISDELRLLGVVE